MFFYMNDLTLKVNIKAARLLRPSNSLQAQLNYVNFSEEDKNYINQQAAVVPLQAIRFDNVSKNQGFVSNKSFSEINYLLSFRYSSHPF